MNVTTVFYWLSFRLSTLPHPTESLAHSAFTIDSVTLTNNSNELSLKNIKSNDMGIVLSI